jgi:hypothetical protein
MVLDLNLYYFKCFAENILCTSKYYSSPALGSKTENREMSTDPDW